MGGGVFVRLPHVFALPLRGGHARGLIVPAGSLMRGDKSGFVADRADACEWRGVFLRCTLNCVFQMSWGRSAGGGGDRAQRCPRENADIFSASKARRAGQKARARARPRGRAPGA